MKIKSTFKKTLLIVTLFFSSFQGKAQAFSEDFANITTLVPGGWFMKNNSSPNGLTGWFQGNTAVFNAQNGAANSYIGANFNNSTLANTISNWLLTPTVTLRNGDVFSFYTRTTIDNLYPDRLQVRLSTSGTSTNVGTTPTSVGNFTTLLLDINPTLVTSVYPTTAFYQYTITISGLSAPTSGRIAFRYFVTNGGPNGANSDYIGIDNVVYTPYVCPTLSVAPTNITSGYAGTAYSQSLTQTGALGTPTYSISSGALPAGLVISVTGIISGTPNVVGQFNFTVSVNDASGCIGSTAYSLIISCPLNGATLNVSPSVVCSNLGVTPISGGSPSGGLYSGIGISGSTFNPTAGSQSITYTTIDNFGCTQTATSAITVNNAPIVSASSSSSAVCLGSSVTLTASGANSYLWSNGVANAVPFIPTSTANYTVTGTDGNNCANTASIAVTVNTLPSIFATASDTIVCYGDAVTLTGAGGSSYLWNNGVINATPFIITSSATYVVTGTNLLNCSANDTLTIIVNALPVVVANASSSSICLNDLLVLTGSGAISFVWDNGVIDGVAFSPIGTVMYIVTGSDNNNCSHSDSVTVVVNNLPTVIANASSSTICSSDSLVLTGVGAVSYVWDNGVIDGVTFSPVGTLTYQVIGTDINNCSNVDTTTVKVNIVPLVTATATAVTLCEGDSVVLAGIGAVSYDWDNGVVDGVAFSQSAGIVTYLVVGLDSNNCKSSDTITVTVNFAPVVDLSLSIAAICETGGILTLSGESPIGGTFTGSGVVGNTFDPSIGAGIYSISYTLSNLNGCSSSAVDTMTVDLCTDIKNMGIGQKINIYPNPSNGTFTLSYNQTKSGNLAIKIFDVQGKVLVNENLINFIGNYSNVFNLSSFVSGIYTVEITGSSKQVHEKVIIQ